MKMEEQQRDEKKLVDPEPCVFVPHDFIKGFEEIIEKLEASRNEFSKMAEEMKSS